MRDYIIRRLLLLAPIMLGVSFLTYAMFNVVPGDAAVMICQFQCTDDTLRDIRHELGLDKPFYKQYTDWLEGIFTGDLGHSYSSKVSVTSELGHRLPITLELMVMGIFLALLLGIPPGVLSAVRPGTLFDWIGRFISVLWLSVPSFYLGILVIAFGFSWFGWTPPQFGQGYVSITSDPWVNIQEFFFPALVLSVGIAAVIMRLTRSSMLEVLRNDYIRTAWSKGLRERTVVWRHALKNALIPVATIVGLQIGALIGGSVIVEEVFNLQGIGFYVVDAIARRDLLVVQSVVLLFATAYVTVNLIVDLAYAWLDPRIHYG